MGWYSEWAAILFSWPISLRSSSRMTRTLFRRLDPEPDLVAVYIDHGHDDVAADQYSLVLFSCEH